MKLRQSASNIGLTLVRKRSMARSLSWMQHITFLLIIASELCTSLTERKPERYLLDLRLITSWLKYPYITFAKSYESTTGRAPALHGLAWPRCANVYTFCGHVFEKVTGNTTRRWIRGGPLQCWSRQNRDHHFMRHLSSPGSSRRGIDFTVIFTQSIQYFGINIIMDKHINQ